MTIPASGYRTAFTLLKGLGLLALLTFGTPAQAVALTDAQRFVNDINSATYKTFLLNAFNVTEPGPLKAKCAALAIVSLDPPLVLVPAKYTQAGNTSKINAGRWVARSTLDRCGTHVIRRLAVEAVPQSGALHAQPLIPGEFPGNIQLETDATHIVLPAAMGIAKCADQKTLYLLDTKLKSPAAAAGWSETWTMQACGQTVTADVIYSADSTGMNVTAKNVKVH